MSEVSVASNRAPSIFGMRIKVGVLFGALGASSDQQVLGWP